MTGSGRCVVFVTQQYPPDKSGHATRISDTAQALARRGWEVTVLAPPACFPHGEFDRSWYYTRSTTESGVEVRRLWAWQPTEPDPGAISRFAYYLTFAFHAAVWLAVTGRRYDAAVTTTPPISTGLPGLVAGAWATPWVVDVRDLWIDAAVSLGFISPGGGLERASRGFQRLVVHAADAVATTTETLGETLCEEYGDELAGKIHVFPNGVDLDRFVGADGDDPLEPTEKHVIVYVGNIGHAQNLDDCIRAMAETEQEAVLRLFGGGDAVPALQRLAEEVSVSDRVEFAGTVPNETVPALLRAADVGVAPLLEDEELAYAMPTKVYEYMGAGLPVVTTGSGELRRFVEDSGGGVHVDSDPSAIAAAFDTLLFDDERRRRLGESGRDHVRPTYDRERIAARFDECLRHVADGEATGTELTATAGPGATGDGVRE